VGLSRGYNQIIVNTEADLLTALTTPTTPGDANQIIIVADVVLSSPPAIINYGDVTIVGQNNPFVTTVSAGCFEVRANNVTISSLVFQTSNPAIKVEANFTKVQGCVFGTNTVAVSLVSANGCIIGSAIDSDIGNGNNFTGADVEILGGVGYNFISGNRFIGSVIRVQSSWGVWIGRRYGNSVYGYNTFTGGLGSKPAITISTSRNSLIYNNWIGTSDGVNSMITSYTHGVSIDSESFNIVLVNNLILGFTSGSAIDGKNSQSIQIANNTIGFDALRNIYIENFQGVTLKNCSIVDIYDDNWIGGVPKLFSTVIMDSADVTVIGNHFTDNNGDIQILNSRRIQVSSNYFSAGVLPVVVTDSSSVTIQNNNLQAMVAGFFVSTSNSIWILGNVINSTQSHSIEVTDSFDIQITSNNVSDNRGIAIYLQNSANNITIKNNNLASLRGSYGIAAYTNENVSSTATGNTIASYPNAGVLIQSPQTT